MFFLGYMKLRFFNKLSFLLPLFFQTFISSFFAGHQIWKGSIHNEAGVTIVNNPAQPIYQESILELIPEFIIPGNDIKGQYSFIRLGDMSFDDQGHLYLLDTKDSCVKVFDAQGRYLKKIGRPGQGPGELDGASEIEVANGLIFVSSLAGRKVHIFNIDGDYKKSIPLPGSFIQLRVDRAGNFYGSLFDIFPEGGINKIVQCDPNFNIKKTYASRKLEQARFYGTVLTCVLAKNEDFIVGNPSDYEISIYDRLGELKKIIKKKHPPIKIPDSEIKRLHKMNSLNWEIPEYFDPFNLVYSDDYGRIIVNTHSIAGQKKAFYDVFDDDGKFLASFVLDNYKNIYWKKDRLYAIDEDGEGLPIVRVFKVNWKENLP